jgi:adenine-specific DNA-methyltransferase
MKPLTSNDPETKSPDVVAENLARLKTLFPEVVTEDGVNVDALKQLIGKTVTDTEEKYGLNWHGKRKARQLALTPSAGTLRPCPEDSVAWDTTRNLMIEGDNLEVLKLLQKSYAGKVKLIYIDPPYNTGEDFVYPDNFQDNIKNYETLMGWRNDEGEKVSSLASRQNSESSGRFHTNWLNMMYPRLRLARNLLREDGVIFISIDDGEVANLRTLCDDIFGPENFVANLVWQSRTSISDDHEISPNHNHTIIYAKQKPTLEFHGEPIDTEEYSNPDNDTRGPWKLVPIDANKPGGDTLYPIRNPKTQQDYYPPEGRSWSINRIDYAKLEADGRIKFGSKDDSAPKRKLFLKERLERGDTKTPSSLLLDAGTTKNGTEETTELMGAKGVFDYPKPVTLLNRLLQYGCSVKKENIVLDFFAGSGTTGQAVFERNSKQSSTVRFILVQLPEPLDPDNTDQKVAAKFCDKISKPRNIAELTKERLRRAGKKIREENPMFAGDLGFRVFKLASSNIQAWEPDRERLAETLEASVEHLKTDRTESDILFELLLKLGLDLTVPIETRTIAGQQVHSIGAGTLLVCLSKSITAKEVEPLALGIAAWHKTQAPAGESTIVFRDSAFADDVDKTNLTAILQQHGLKNVRSL